MRVPHDATTVMGRNGPLGTYCCSGCGRWDCIIATVLVSVWDEAFLADRPSLGWAAAVVIGLHKCIVIVRKTNQ